MQTNLRDSVWIYADNGTCYEIRQQDDLYYVRRNGVLNDIVKFESLWKAVREVESWAKKFEKR